ncbi:MAG TPA: STAS domain-containing protein [Bacteroidetes bacterium]|nr:STAS domain-containing protein [Bacteroidota bacterium]
MPYSVPILTIRDILVVPIQVDMDDSTVSRLQNDILQKLDMTGARGVLIDISVLTMVDSYFGRMLADTARMAGLMDARLVITGMQPAVAITLVELGLQLDNLHSALDLESGISLLEMIIERDGGSRR